MAIDLTLKSLAIANREASPAVLNNPGAGGVSRLRQVFSHIASVAAGLSATSIIRIVEVPSNAIVTSVLLSCGAQGAAGAADIGIYKSNKDGGTVVDADFFASATSLISAVNESEMISESGVNTIPKKQQPLWQALGLSADPKITYDVALTVTTDITTGGTPIALRVSYVQ